MIRLGPYEISWCDGHWVVRKDDEIVRIADSLEEAEAGYCPECQELVEYDDWLTSPEACDSCIP